MGPSDATASKRKVVLVVEDDDDLRIQLVELLTDNGYRVLVTSNGAEALAVLDQVTPHLILLDLMMPILSGWEVLAVIGDDPVLMKIPVVVFSAYASQGPAGVACTLSKPICMDSLLAAVRQHCA